MNIKRIIRRTLYTIACVTLVWLIASYANTVSHNMTDQMYATWNFFHMITYK